MIGTYKETRVARLRYSLVTPSLYIHGPGAPDLGHKVIRKGTLYLDSTGISTSSFLILCTMQGCFFFYSYNFILFSHLILCTMIHLLDMNVRVFLFEEFLLPLFSDLNDRHHLSFAEQPKLICLCKIATSTC